MRSAQESFRAIFLLHRPKQAASFIQAGIVRPAVERRETLSAGTGAAAAVANAVRPRAVPRHANEERSIVAIIRRPPRLRCGHQGMQILDDGMQVERLELRGVIELLVHRIGEARNAGAEFSDSVDAATSPRWWGPRRPYAGGGLPPSGILASGNMFCSCFSGASAPVAVWCVFPCVFLFLEWVKTYDEILKTPCAGFSRAYDMERAACRGAQFPHSPRKINSHSRSTRLPKGTGGGLWARHTTPGLPRCRSGRR